MTFNGRIGRTALSVAIAGGLFAGAVVALDASRGTNPAVGAAPASALDAAIDRARARLATEPDHVASNANLAASALVKARVSADATWYGVAETAARRALKGDPRQPEALDALGTLALARHRFAAALPFAERSRRAQPARLAPYEIQIDALIELGRYRQAFPIVEERLRLRPDLASYSRASYAAELRGERDLARRYMALAADAGRPGGEERAWAAVQLGNLRFGDGDLRGAEREMRRVLATRPDDARALAGLGQVRAAQGRLDDAERLHARALELQGTSSLAATLAEVQEARGDTAGRDRSLALAREIDRGEERNGVLLDLDIAGFEANWKRPSPTDVAAARKAHAQRPGIVGDGVLGWVLTRAGECDEGLRLARRSLRLGTQDSLMLFHAGMAAACAGERPEAIRYLHGALDLNPRFSVKWAPVATRTLSEIDG